MGFLGIWYVHSIYIVKSSTDLNDLNLDALIDYKNNNIIINAIDSTVIKILVKGKLINNLLNFV